MNLATDLTGVWDWLSSAPHAELKPVTELETAGSREFLQVGSALVQALLQCVSLGADGQSQSSGEKWTGCTRAEAVHITALSCWAATRSSTQSWPGGTRVGSPSAALLWVWKWAAAASGDTGGMSGSFSLLPCQLLGSCETFFTLLVAVSDLVCCCLLQLCPGGLEKSLWVTQYVNCYFWLQLGDHLLTLQLGKVI